MQSDVMRKKITYICHLLKTDLGSASYSFILAISACQKIQNIPEP